MLLSPFAVALIPWATDGWRQPPHASFSSCSLAMAADRFSRYSGSRWSLSALQPAQETHSSSHSSSQCSHVHGMNSVLAS